MRIHWVGLAIVTALAAFWMWSGDGTRGTLARAASHASVEPGFDAPASDSSAAPRTAEALLEARITRPDGQPIADALVWLACPREQLSIAPADEPATSAPSSNPGPTRVDRKLGELHWTGRTDATGRVALAGLPRRVSLRAQAAFAGVVYEIQERVALEADVERRTWVLSPPRVISGHATDRSGRPLAGVRLWARSCAERIPATYFHRGERAQATALVDAEGAFRFEPLAPGRYHVGPAPDNEAFRELPAFATLVDTTDGEPADLTLVLDTALYLRGVVVGADGAPSADAQVLALAAMSSGYVASRTDEHGEFQLGPVQRGEFELRASADTCPCAARPVSVSTEDGLVILDLVETSTVRIAIPSAEPFLAGEVIVTAEDGTLLVDHPRSPSSNSCEIAGLSPGPYAIAIRSLDGRIATIDQVVATPEDTAVHEARLVESATLTLRNDDAVHAQNLVVKDVRGTVVAVASLRPAERQGAVVPVGLVTIERTGLGAQVLTEVEMTPAHPEEIVAPSIP